MAAHVRDGVGAGAAQHRHAAGAAHSGELVVLDGVGAALRLYAAAHRGEVAVLAGWGLAIVGAAAYVVLTGPGFSLLGALLFICAGTVWSVGHCMNIWGSFTAVAGSREGEAAAPQGGVSATGCMSIWGSPPASSSQAAAAAAAAPLPEGGATATAMPAASQPKGEAAPGGGDEAKAAEAAPTAAA